MDSIRSLISNIIHFDGSANRFLPPLIAIGGGCLLVLPVLFCMATVLVVMAVGPVYSEGGDIGLSSQVEQEEKGDVKNEKIVSTATIETFTLSCGDQGTGSLGIGATDYWRFEGHADDLVTVRLVSLDDELKPRLRLRPDSGEGAANEKFATVGNDNVILIENLFMPNDAEYIIVVSAISGQGEYEIGLTCRSSPTPTSVPTATSSPEPSLTPEPTAIPGLGTGDVQITLIWWSTADLDLHVVDPNGEEIYFENASADSGGKLDFEGNGSCALATTSPVENVFWASETAPPGEYAIAVHYFGTCREEGEQDFQVIVRVDGRVLEIVSGSVAPFEGLQVYQFSYK